MRRIRIEGKRRKGWKTIEEKKREGRERKGKKKKDERWKRRK